MFRCIGNRVHGNNSSMHFLLNIIILSSWVLGGCYLLDTCYHWVKWTLKGILISSNKEKRWYCFLIWRMLICVFIVQIQISESYICIWFCAKLVSFSQEANKPPDTWFELKVNTHVYVTGLPDDVTEEEVSHVTVSFSVLIFHLSMTLIREMYCRWWRYFPSVE